MAVAGLGFGWIWHQLYAMPVVTPALPGHRPSLYFMTRDLGQLHSVLHLHDWRAMLADERVRLIIGTDPFEQLERSLLTDTRLPWPKLAVTVEPSCWPAGKNVDELVQSLSAHGGERLADLARHNVAASAGFTASAASIWPEYGSISFDSADAARRKVERFLCDEPARRAVASSMRQRVLDRLTYGAVTRRLLAMIRADLGKQASATLTARAA